MNARALLLGALLVALPAHASDQDFDLLVKHLRTHAQKAPMGTGFLGFLARCFSPKGVSGLRMAIFEDIDLTKSDLGGDFDGFVRRTVGPDREPFVRAVNRNGHKVYVYMQPKGSQAELLLLAVESKEAVVMKMRLDPDRMQEWMVNPEGMARKRRCKTED